MLLPLITMTDTTFLIACTFLHFSLSASHVLLHYSQLPFNLSLQLIVLPQVNRHASLSFLDDYGKQNGDSDANGRSNGFDTANIPSLGYPRVSNIREDPCLAGFLPVVIRYCDRKYSLKERLMDRSRTGVRYVCSMSWIFGFCRYVRTRHSVHSAPCPQTFEVLEKKRLRNSIEY